MFVNEDVSVGTWLAPLDVKKIHDERFRMYGECKEEHIILHYSSINEMKVFNKSVAVNNTLCRWKQKDDKERTIFKGNNTEASLQESKFAQTRKNKIKQQARQENKLKEQEGQWQRSSPVTFLL